ncbi:MAG TPA: helix-turn-helix transcriptional regulator [Polyangiaceae bacterium]|nr:helix-turn-helix transcriptional regulator [Polyangiaceae bacterium]
MLSVAHLNEMAAIAAEVSNPVSYESELFRVIDGVVGAEVAFFKRDGMPGPVVRGLDAAWLAEVERSLFDCRHEMLDLLAVARREGGVAVDLDVLGIRALERKRYYQALMKPTGGRCGAFLPVWWRGQCLTVLVLGRDRAFRPRELERLQRLAPTLQLCELSRRASIPANSASGPRMAPALTSAEREVLSYLHLGYSNAQIASARGNAERTVRNQLSSAYAKLGVGTRAEAVAVWAELDDAG